MTKRYFKATDGKITVFRATDTKIYASANFHTYESGGAFHCGRDIGFSGRSPSTHGYAAVEISRAEYDHLTAIKQARIVGQGSSLKYSTSPSDSWVRNTQLEG